MSRTTCHFYRDHLSNVGDVFVLQFNSEGEVQKGFVAFKIIAYIDLFYSVLVCGNNYCRFNHIFQIMLEDV